MAYVALTRARHRVSIFWSSTLWTFQNFPEEAFPSRFIGNIPTHLRLHSQTYASVGASGERPGNSFRNDAGGRQTAVSASSMEKRQLPVWKPGVRVLSGQFGEGTVLGYSALGQCRVRFEDGQARNILASYLREAPAESRAPGAGGLDGPGGPGASGRAQAKG